MHTPKSAMTLNEELIQLRQQVKVQEKEIRRLKKGINIPSERTAYRGMERKAIVLTISLMEY